MYLPSEIEDIYGVVTVVNHKLYCMLCCGVCKHTLYVEELIHDSDHVMEDLGALAALLSSQSSQSRSGSPIGISWMKIPFILSHTLSPGQWTDGIVFSSRPQRCSSCKSDVIGSSISLPLIMERNICTALGTHIVL